MPETIIESILNGKITHEVLVNWLNDETIEDSPEYSALLCCNRSEFVTYFLSFLRNQTDSVLQTNSNALNLIQHQGTPEKVLSSRRKHQRSVSEPTSELEGDRNNDSLTLKTDRIRSHESPNRDRSQKKIGRKVKTKLFNESEKSSSFATSKTDSDDSRLSAGVDSLVISSTPLKNGISASDYPNLPFTSPVIFQSKSANYERCDTPRVSHKHSKSQEKSSFGDYLANAQVKSSKKKRVTPRNVSKEAEDKQSSLDISNSEMFPEIGARKSSSLRSEKRRIKPTNIDTSTPQKSFSLNSFNSESFQQPSPLVVAENSAFKHQKLQPKELANSFEAERNILKQERHKLMEKFNVLNTSSPQKSPLIPQINKTKDSAERAQSFVTADASKILFREKIDCLIDTYEVLLKNNLILSMSNEIYFLISIVLCQQYEEEYSETEKRLNSETTSEFLLKTIHNSTYFAVKSLWHQKHVLEFMLDKNSLKILGENKKVRSFYPDLAKFLLNLYGIKSECDQAKEEKAVPQENKTANGIVCFNFETDNCDNFPSQLSFQNFKKQRDMFYEILRWYNDTSHTNATKATFRSRVKSLLSLAVAPTNHAHLARLFTQHMIAECLANQQQESKLSKLQRRLAGPATPPSLRLPRFSAREMFYKELLTYAESESYRAHVRDALASEICALDARALAADHDRANSPNQDMSGEYVQLSRRLGLLAKFLGYLTSLPYSQLPTDYCIKTGSAGCQSRDRHIVPPKERVFENDLGLRNYFQPALDLKSILADANKNSRLCITLPWLVQYLAMLDYTGLRTSYYENLLRHIFQIYIQKLRITDTNAIKKNTVIFLKLTLGWLFDLPHFPQEIFYQETLLEHNLATPASDVQNIDCLDIIGDSILFEVCPFLKDINVLLVTSKPAQEVREGGSFRHITPVSVTLNPEDRIRNKEKEIQTRLEQEYLKGLTSSTRRVAEVVTERVTSWCVRRLVAALHAARPGCRALLRDIALQQSPSTRLSAARAMYAAALDSVRAGAGAAVRRGVRARVRGALGALGAGGAGGPGGAGGGGAALEAHVSRHCRLKLDKWLHEHWNTTDVLCKDIETELQTAVLLTDDALREEDATHTHSADALVAPEDQFNVVNVSPNNVIIELKEQICLLLEYRDARRDVTALLATATLASDVHNVFTRAPCRRALAHLALDLALVYASRRPAEVTEELLDSLAAVWGESPIPSTPTPAPACHDHRNFDVDDRVPTPVSDGEGPAADGPVKFVYPAPSTPITTKSAPMSPVYPITGLISPNVPVKSPSSANLASKRPVSPNVVQRVPPSPNVGQKEPLSPNVGQKTPSSPNPRATVDAKEDVLDYLNRVLCPRNIVILSSSRCDQTEVWSAMSRLLSYLLRRRYLSEDSLTEQCLAVYRQDWPQSTLEQLSHCMRAVCSQSSCTGKLSLFLHFLAEYCIHMH